MAANPALKKELVQCFQKQVVPFLYEHGFDDFHDTLAWRTTDSNIDVVGLVVEGSSRVKGYWPDDSIGYYIEAGTYYRCVEFLPWTDVRVKRATFPKSQVGSPTDCHRRLLLGGSQVPGLQTTLHLAGNDIPARVEDAKAAFLSRSIPWLESTHDIGYIVDEYENPTQQYSPAWSRPPELLTSDRERSWTGPTGDLALGLLLTRNRFDLVLSQMERELDFYRNGGTPEPNGRRHITPHMKRMAAEYPARIAAIEAMRDREI